MSTHVKEHLPAYLSGELEQDAVNRVQAHLAHCEACRKEFEALHSLWLSLEGIPAEEPGPAVKMRFYEMLSAATAMQEKIAQPREVRRPAPEKTFWLIPRRAVFQFAGALAILAAGILIGTGLSQKNNAPAPAPSEITQLHDEVQTMSRLLTVSLLQQQSASDRLRGVSWSYRVDEPDPEILSALLQTLKYDPNVNVRLASLDALSHLASQANTKRELLSALPKQTSPLVQMAMIDLIFQWHERQSAELLKQMLADPKTNSDVKKRIEQGIGQIS